jgi:hypothetical protein
VSRQSRVLFVSIVLVSLSIAALLTLASFSAAALAPAAPPVTLAPLVTPEPQVTLAPLVIPEDLVTLAPLVTPEAKTRLFFRVGPDAPKPCPDEQVAFTIYLGQGPAGLTLQQASDQGLLKGMPNTLVTVTDNGQTLLRQRTNANGLIEPDWKWTAKEGNHTLVFVAGARDQLIVQKKVNIKPCK